MKATTCELYSLAREARNANDWAAANTYYETISQKDPDGWEAPFYLKYYEVYNTSNAACEENCKNFSMSFCKLFPFAQKRCKDVAELISIAKEMQEGTEFLAETVIKRTYGDYPWLSTEKEVSDRVCSALTMLLVFAVSLDRIFENGEMTLEATKLRKQAIEYYAELARKLNIGAKLIASGDFQSFFGETINKIKEFEPEYKQPSLVETTSYNSVYSSKSSSSPHSSSGCYVATAVYGSYDCPQVWTLRRFRDFFLAKTWYGRAFIKTYYAISPSLVKWCGHTNWFRAMWRGPLDSIVSTLQNYGFDNMPYSDME